MERSIERRVLVFLLLLTHVGSGWSEETQSPSDKAFNTTCFACHTIGGDRLVGPDLAGIQDKRTHEWLVKFIAVERIDLPRSWVD